MGRGTWASVSWGAAKPAMRAWTFRCGASWRVGAHTRCTARVLGLALPSSSWCAFAAAWRAVSPTDSEPAVETAAGGQCLA
ncbi:MAG: hypothetical protein ACXWQR_16685, partial [Ktedonobacterales bacterium]